jgi:hypothetical protein
MPRDTKLWVQYCRLELMYWEKLLLRRELLGIQATVCRNRKYNVLGRLCPTCKAIGQLDVCYAYNRPMGLQEGEESQQVLDGELPRIVFRNATQGIAQERENLNTQLSIGKLASHFLKPGAFCVMKKVERALGRVVFLRSIMQTQALVSRRHAHLRMNK